MFFSAVIRNYVDPAPLKRGFCQMYQIMSAQNREDLKVLRQKSVVLQPPFAEDIHSTIQRMVETLKRKGGGAGLAAPQIGINQSIIVCSFSRRIEDIQPMINPEYTPNEEAGTEEGWEGCFSIPLSVARMVRWKEIQVSYYKPDGVLSKEIFRGWPACVFQHECDHVNGILMTDSKNLKTLKTFDTEQEYKDFLIQLRQARTALSSDSLTERRSI